MEKLHKGIQRDKPSFLKRALRYHMRMHFGEKITFQNNQYRMVYMILSF